MTFLRQDSIGGVLALTFDDVPRRNPIGDELRAELLEALETALTDASVRVVVFTGAGGVFSSGGDLASMPPPSLAAADARLADLRRLIELVAHSPKPTIAAVEGYAAGASCGLAAACDVVIASTTARFLLPFTRLGLVPDAGLLASLPARVGVAAAKRLLMIGDPITAEAAFAAGLADELVAEGEALIRATAVAVQLAGRAPQSIEAIKAAFSAGALDLAAALDFEAARQRDTYFSAQFAEGKSAFFDKRAPNFTDDKRTTERNTHGIA